MKMMLEKIQPDMLSTDRAALGRLNTKSLQEKMEEKAKLLWVKPKKIDFEPRHRKKGRSRAGKR